MTQNQSKDNPILLIRTACGDTQAAFAARLGVDVRSIKRYESEKRLPRSESILRTLRTLAKKHDIKI